MTLNGLFLVLPAANLSLGLLSPVRTTISYFPVLATNQANLHFHLLFRLNFFRNLLFPLLNDRGPASALQAAFAFLLYFLQATCPFARLDI